MADPTKARTPEQQQEDFHTSIEQSLMAHLAEHTALACLMRRPGWIHQAADELPAEWFQSRPGRAIYDAMLGESVRARQEDRAPNLGRVGLCQYAERAGIAHEFAKATQPRSQDMLECVENLRIEPTPTTMWQAMASMREARRRLEAYRALKRAQVAVITTEDEPVAQLADAQLTLAELTDRGPGPALTQKVGDVTVDLLAGEVEGVRPSHLPGFAGLTHGFRPGSLSVLCARSGVGKSAFMGAIARDAAMRGVPVLYLDQEMHSAEVYYRHLAALSDVNENVIRGGLGDGDHPDLPRIERAQQTLRTLPLWHSSAAGRPLPELLAEIRRFKRIAIDTAGGGRGLVVFDYIKLPTAARPGAREFAVLGEIATALKDTANQLGVPVLAGAQANRSALSMDPKQHADEGSAVVFGSDMIQHTCDVLAVLRDLRQGEQQRVGERFGRVDDGTADTRNHLRFNQLLHVHKVRGGTEHKTGLPLHYRRGFAQYAERYYQSGDDGVPIRDDRGRLVKSPEAAFVVSADFRRKPRSRREGQTALPPKQAD